ncbi:MAG TPA: hypothetical protein VGJ33_18475 [Candidatus Angelobacter sp.]|jgi:hypothetical protein
MKLFCTLNQTRLLAFFLLLFAAPAFAQFEVSPDHFDGPENTKPKKVVSKKSQIPRLAASHKVRAVKLKQAGTQISANTSSHVKAQPSRKVADIPSAAKSKGPAMAGHRNSTPSTQAESSLKAQAAPVSRE